MKRPVWIHAFNRSQSRAIVLLIVLELLLLAVPDPVPGKKTKAWQVRVDTIKYIPELPLRQKPEPVFAVAIQEKKAPRPKIARNSSPKKYRQQTEYQKTDINTADSLAWQQFRGIGVVLSGRIIRFRDKLGGFAQASQVGETYGLPDSVFRQIQPFLYVGQPHSRLAINQAGISELVRHPYIPYELAVGIVRLREKQGKINNVEALLTGIPGQESNIKRALPYFSW